MTRRGKAFVLMSILEGTGAAAKPARLLLLKVAQNEKANSATQIATPDLALRALVEIDPTADDLLPLFARELLATNAAAGAAYGLAQLGEPGMSFLIQASTNQDNKIRASAEAALGLKKYMKTEHKYSFSPFYHFSSVYSSRLFRSPLARSDTKQK